MIIPRSIEDVETLVTNQVQEDIHLDYKDSRALDKRSEITKDVSAFANSDGGVLVYGVTEVAQLPQTIDQGADFSKREWLDQILQSGINPRLDDYEIIALPLLSLKAVFVIRVGKSYRGPHQAEDHKYYKRFNFSSVPMEDYEIRDVRTRRQRAESLVFVGVANQSILSYIEIANNANSVAKDVTFSFSEPVRWQENASPKILSAGIDQLAPGTRFRFRYHTFPEMNKSDGSIISKFDVIASYYHPDVDARVSDTWHLDFTAYFDSAILYTDAEIQGKAITEQLKSIATHLGNLDQRVSRIAGATGLDLSITTIRNLKRVMTDELEHELVDAAGCPPDVIREVLGTSPEMTMKLTRGFRSGMRVESVDQIEGMTEELAAEIRRRFRFDKT